MVVAAAVALGLALASCGGVGASLGATDRGAPVTVFAAASLTQAFTEVAALDPALDVSFAFDGSPTLVDQVSAGAPADVLATSDEATMARAERAGLVRSPPLVFATNAAALIVPAGNPAGITGLDRSLEGRKLVVCAPTVPCGAVARAIAHAAGVTLAPVSEEQKVTDVRGKVESGEADAGIVFATDAQAAGAAVEAIPLPGAERALTRSSMALVAGARNPEEGAAFIDLVSGPRGREVLARHGFGTP